MSRVEQKHDREQQRRESEQRQPATRTPGKAEGEVRDVEEALRNDEKRNR